MQLLDRDVDEVKEVRRCLRGRPRAPLLPLEDHIKAKQELLPMKRDLEDCSAILYVGYLYDLLQ